MMASFSYLYPNEQSHGRLDEHVAIGTNYVWIHLISNSSFSF